MADSSRSLSRFFSPQTDTDSPPENDDEDELINEDYIHILLDKETHNNHIEPHDDELIKIHRSEAIQWIFNTRSSLQFQLQTAYLSVTFIDRFISKQRIIASEKPWAIQLLAIACLSIAAKMIEHEINTKHVLSLLLLHSNQFRFETKTIQRMELIVLTTLDWKMHSITPFRFVRYFVSCFCNECEVQARYMSRISHIICATTNDLVIMSSRSSTIALAATLMAMDEDLSKETMEMKVKNSLMKQLFDHVSRSGIFNFGIIRWDHINEKKLN
ncbi:hypothetical protein QVD17_39247 [Tagetes erecta]|uniref:Cyclin-like domain-containing protein n=1 Tax=Tagetes erecta TaxID=13708 RepID=A0AAD8NG25_TARER|nr:hypothetical protein QVD17_39247 [Tagetes erecta]